MRLPAVDDRMQLLLGLGIAQEESVGREHLGGLGMHDRQAAPQLEQEIQVDRLPGPLSRRAPILPPASRVMLSCAGKAGAMIALRNRPPSRQARISSAVRPRSSESIFLKDNAASWRCSTQSHVSVLCSRVSVSSA